MVTEWDANQYRLFALERNWPNEELIAKIHGEPSRIADLGCGSGDCSTLALRRRYPHADIHAIDSSASLIDEARQLQPAADVEWRTGLIETFEADEGTDLLYLGSSFQWIADHPRQLVRLGAMLTAGGTLAIQMPNMFCTPFYTAILAVAGTAEWKGRLQGKLRQAPVLGADEYAAIMASLGVTCEIWTSTYELTFSGVEGLVEWAKGARRFDRSAACSIPRRSRCIARTIRAIWRATTRTTMAHARCHSNGSSWLRAAERHDQAAECASVGAMPGRRTVGPVRRALTRELTSPRERTG